MSRRAWRVGLPWLLWTGLLLWYLVSSLQISSDLTLFLPNESGRQERQVVSLLREGAASRLLLLGLSGGSEGELTVASRALVEHLRNDPLFVQVSNGADDMGATERGHWFRYRYLLSPAVEESSYSTSALRQALYTRLDELASPLGALTKQTLPDDPLAAFAALLQQWKPNTQLQYRQGVWFSADGREALLFVLTRAGGFDLDAQQRAIDAVRKALSELPKAGILQLSMSGPGYIGMVTRDTIRAESQWLSCVAGLVVAVLLWLAYRSLPFLLLSTIPLLFALLVGTAATLMVFGNVHGITLAFGMTLLGVAIDYPLHLFSHLHAQESTAQSLRRVWPTLRLGVLSTVLGYLAMMLSDFPGLQQLAVFAVSGALASAAVVRWLLPSLVEGHERAVRLQRFGDEFSHKGSRYALIGMLGLIVLALSYLALSPQPLWQTDLAALSPVPERLRIKDAQLRRQLGAADLNYMLLVDGDSAEQVLQRCETLRPALHHLQHAGVIGTFQLPSDILPSVSLQRSRQQMLPTASELSERLQSAGSDLPFRTGLFAPFVAAVADSAALMPLTPEAIADTMLGLRLQSVLYQEGGRWTALVQLSEVHDGGELAQWAKQLSAEFSYLDVRGVTAQMVARFRDEALGYLMVGLALIILLLRYGLGSWRTVLPVALPVATAVSLTVALLHTLGLTLSLFNLMALLLVLGIGLDYGLFFSRAEQSEERRRTGHALGLCAISTISVFGILALSHIPVLRAIGLTVAMGAFLAYWLARWGRAPTTAG